MCFFFRFCFKKRFPVELMTINKLYFVFNMTYVHKLNVSVSMVGGISFTLKKRYGRAYIH